MLYTVPTSGRNVGVLKPNICHCMRLKLFILQLKFNGLKLGLTCTKNRLAPAYTSYLHRSTASRTASRNVKRAPRQ